MKLVLGQVAEIEGGFKMMRAIELPEELANLPKPKMKVVLFNAYRQLMDAERKAEIAELEKLASE